MKTAGTKLTKVRWAGHPAYVADHPLTVDEFCDLFGEDDDVELIDGIAVEQMIALDPHEDLFRFLHGLLNLYAEVTDLGLVRGSRTMVPITPYRGRLPDILFVKKEREHAVSERGLATAPDLVIEIVFPGDRRVELLAKEADYRQIGVGELWFVDLPRREVRGWSRNDVSGEYEPLLLEDGVLKSRVVEGFTIPVEWLWQKPLPKVLDAAREMGLLP